MNQKTFDKLFESTLWPMYLNLIYTDGQLDLQKIKNEMCDLCFVNTQAGEVYYAITNGLLSKTNYFSKSVLSACRQEFYE